MIKPPSAIKHYTLIFSGDPALTLPADVGEEVEAGAPAPAQTGPSDRERALTVARETGQWGSLLAPGATPTLFHLRPLPGSAYEWFLGECRRRDLNLGEAQVLILRLALRKIENFGGHIVRVSTVDGQELAGVDIIDALYAEAGAHRRAIIAELALEVIRRAENATPPKS